MPNVGGQASPETLARQPKLNTICFRRNSPVHHPSSCSVQHPLGRHRGVYYTRRQFLERDLKSSNGAAVVKFRRVLTWNQAGFVSVHLRNHSIGKMMARLIVLLAGKPGLEVHVFVRGGAAGAGGVGSGSGSQAGEEGMEKRGGDPIEEVLRSRVHRWHQV